jgi:hypothetical protein
MDIVEFFCKFGNGDCEQTRKQIVDYFGESSLLYSILKGHGLLHSKIDHVIYENRIEFIIYTTDSTLFDSLVDEYKNTITVNSNNGHPIVVDIVRDFGDPCKIIVTMR